MTSNKQEVSLMENDKIYHKADKLNAKGEVSALCFPRPHAIDLRRELWTIRDDAVTCRKCLKILAAMKKGE